MKQIDVITDAEIEAYNLVGCNRDSTLATPSDWHEAGNYIIELAERIKAERAIATMNSAAEASAYTKELFKKEKENEKQ